MSSEIYPYWLSALIGAKEKAQGYSKLVGNNKTFFYTFPDYVPIYSATTNLANGFTPFNSIQKQNAVLALEYIQSITALTFVQSDHVLASNTLVFALNTQEKDSYGYAYLPEIHPLGSDIYFAIHPTNVTMSVGTRGAQTLIHEIGHALGLKHPHEEADDLGKNSLLSLAEDNNKNSVMSYVESTTENFTFTLGKLDIAALHYIYGPNPDARVSDDSYLISSGTSNFIWDGAGIDTIDASRLDTRVTLHLEPGHHDFVGEEPMSIVSAPGQITVNYGTIIENVIGTQFNDTLFGNAQDNFITGNGGSDRIFGGEGLDTAIFAESLSSITLSGNKVSADFTWIITLPNGDKSTLTDVERLSFADSYVALDLDGNAGKIAKLLGAFIGSKGVTNKSLFGSSLRYLDSGVTYEKLMELAIFTVFGQTPDSRAVVSTFYENVMGQQAPAGLTDKYARSLDEGDLSVLSLAQQVVDHDLNLANIELVGLAATGIEYS